MDTRISVLQEEMAKLQEDLRELQAENARVTMTNERLQDEVKTLHDANRSLSAQIGDNGKPMTTNNASEASPVERSRESGPDGALAVRAEPNDKGTLGGFAQSTDHISDTETSTSGLLPADARNRLKGHANYCEEHLWILWSNSKLTAFRICSIMSSQFCYGRDSRRTSKYAKSRGDHRRPEASDHYT